MKLSSFTPSLPPSFLFSFFSPSSFPPTHIYWVSIIYVRHRWCTQFLVYNKYILSDYCPSWDQCKFWCHLLSHAVSIFLRKDFILIPFSSLKLIFVTAQFIGWKNDDTVDNDNSNNRNVCEIQFLVTFYRVGETKSVQKPWFKHWADEQMWQ